MNAPTAPAAWHLAAFEADLKGDVVPIDIGDRPLVAVRLDGKVRVFDATCPHRGAHLGYGARIDRDCLLCPFHGRRVHLGLDQPGDYRIAEHPVLHIGQALFVRFDDGPDHGFSSMMAGLADSHHVVAGFATQVRVDGSIIVENAFDPEHFRPVHGAVRPPEMDPYEGEHGELIVESELTTPGGADWDEQGRGITRYRFFARAFSPHLVVTQLGPVGPSPYFFTGTTPTPNGCIARVAMAVPNRPGGDPPGYVEGLISGSREAFREDIPVWEHIVPGFTPRYDARDKPVLAFRDFVATF